MADVSSRLGSSQFTSGTHSAGVSVADGACVGASSTPISTCSSPSDFPPESVISILVCAAPLNDFPRTNASGASATSTDSASTRQTRLAAKLLDCVWDLVESPSFAAVFDDAVAASLDLFLADIQQAVFPSDSPVRSPTRNAALGDGDSGRVVDVTNGPVESPSKRGDGVKHVILVNVVLAYRTEVKKLLRADNPGWCVPRFLFETPLPPVTCVLVVCCAPSSLVNRVAGCVSLTNFCGQVLREAILPDAFFKV